MPATMATVSGILKEVYEPRMNEQIEDENTALRRVEKTSEGTSKTLGGRYTTFAIHTRRNTGLGARKEMELLPTPGQQGAAAATVRLKHLYGSAQLSGQTLELVHTDIQSFTSALDFEMNGLKDDLAKDLNRQVYGDGRGTIATVKTANAAAVIVAVDRADLFNVGDLVDIVTAPATVAVSGRTVTAVDLTAGAHTVTLSGANFAVTVGQLITRNGNSPAALGDNREWTGFAAIVTDTGSLYGVDPATEPVWKAHVNSNGGVNRALSEGLMIEMADRIRTVGGKTTVIFTSLGVRRAYFNLLSAQRQFSGTKTFTGGFEGLVFTTDKGELPVITDTDAPPNTMQFINEGELKLYRTHDWQFMDRDGSKWQRVIGYDAYSATMYQYSELGTHRRNTHGVIKDITEG